MNKDPLTQKEKDELLNEEILEDFKKAEERELKEAGLWDSLELTEEE